ncbi:MAG TPA: response regulator [Waterburya sp.]|jgi:CheY-like chemotaxis protein
MNHTILLVEDNPDDQFLIKRALNPRILNQSNLVPVWSKPAEKTLGCNFSSLKKTPLVSPPVPFICQQAELAVSVELVENKEEAEQYLKGRKSYGNRECYPLPILILISLTMPHLSGLSLLTWIKRQPELMHLPIVMISDVDKKEQALNLGASAYIFKTLCFTALTEFVRTFLIKFLNSQRQCQPQQRSHQLPTSATPATPSLLQAHRSTRGVIQTISWRRTSQKMGQSSLQVPL